MDIARHPLTDNEKRLIEAATNRPWTPNLRQMLQIAARQRGFYVGIYDNCGDLVDAIESAANAR